MQPFRFVMLRWIRPSTHNCVSSLNAIVDISAVKLDSDDETVVLDGDGALETTPEVNRSTMIRHFRQV